MLIAGEILTAATRGEVRGSVSRYTYTDNPGVKFQKNRTTKDQYTQASPHMSDSDAKHLGANRRVCNRLSLSRRMLLELDNGEILIGDTEDISLRGVLLKTDVRPAIDLRGITGKLFVIGQEGTHADGYPCKVVRVKDTSIALELDKKFAAAFGQRITNDLFGA